MLFLQTHYSHSLTVLFEVKVKRSKMTQTGFTVLHVVDSHEKLSMVHHSFLCDWDAGIRSSPPGTLSAAQAVME